MKEEKISERVLQISLKLNSPIIYSNNIFAFDKEYGLHGDYQLDNIKNSIAIVNLIKEFNLDNDKIDLGIKKTVLNTRFYGRWQIKNNHSVILMLHTILMQLKK